MLSIQNCFTQVFFTGFKESASTAIGGPSLALMLVFVKLHSKLSQGTGLAEKKPKTKQGRRKKIKVMGFPAFALCVAHKSLEVEERNCPLA